MSIDECSAHGLIYIICRVDVDRGRGKGVGGGGGGRVVLNADVDTGRREV